MFHSIDPTAPELVAEDGRLFWRFPNGKVLPVVRGGDGDDDGEKKFTQAELDRIVQDRIARVQPKPPADYADLQAKAQKLAELEAKDNTELDNAKARIADLEGKLSTAEAERDTARGESTTTRLQMAVVAEAAKQKAVNPDQVFRLLPKDAVTIGDDGQVTGAESAVKAFIEANPHFVGAQRTPASRLQGGGDGDSKSFGEQGRAEAAKRFGTANAGATGGQQQQ